MDVQLKSVQLSKLSSYQSCNVITILIIIIKVKQQFLVAFFRIKILFVLIPFKIHFLFSKNNYFRPTWTLIILLAILLLQNLRHKFSSKKFRCERSSHFSHHCIALGITYNSYTMLRATFIEILGLLIYILSILT